MCAHNLLIANVVDQDEFCENAASFDRRSIFPFFLLCSFKVFVGQIKLSIRGEIQNTFELMLMIDGVRGS